MKWSLQQLQKINNRPYIVNVTYDYSDYLEKIKNTGTETDILDVKKVDAIISIEKIDMDNFKFNYQISAELEIACALTLEPVQYNMNINVSETYSTNPDEEDEEQYPFDGNTIDTKMIVWSNILVNIPIRVVRDDAYEILKSRNIVLDEEIPEED